MEYDGKKQPGHKHFSVLSLLTHSDTVHSYQRVTGGLFCDFFFLVRQRLDQPEACSTKQAYESNSRVNPGFSKLQ